jgi:hypothetical protein
MLDAGHQSQKWVLIPLHRKARDSVRTQSAAVTGDASLP